MAITSHGRGTRTTENAPARRCFSTCWAIARRREFFAKMATAAYDERERGHTGNFFNMLWALPGAARCGPLATGAYLKEQGWYYDLARNWEGGFVYQGSPAEARRDHDNYTDWD